MKNADIITLVQAGVLELTAFCLSPSEAYGLYKFRKALRAAYDTICSAEMDLLSNAGIDDPQKFEEKVNSMMKEVIPSYETACELDRLLKQKDEFLKLKKCLIEDESTLCFTAALTYPSWRALQLENKEKSQLYGKAEELLEGILWLAPMDNQ